MISKKILIVDDSVMNQELLAEIIRDKYEYETADNGKTALDKILLEPEKWAMVLLDLNMPEMGGFDVLDKINMEGLHENIPIIIVSSETDVNHIELAYQKGAVDFISRPYNDTIILRRISNTLELFTKKENLESILIQLLYDKEKENQYMIDVLANLIEFRNGETAAHILNIRSFTALILRTLKDYAPQYNLNSEIITNIINASSLHDIGKIAVPLEILNKPARLTQEEFQIIKKHSEQGAKILKNANGYDKSETFKIAHDICRWHHERFDGKGYPDGLCGDDIPIAAQVVALADVYDALTSERCYKKAYSHEQAIEMILKGECGTFNPALIEVLKIIESKLKNGLNKDTLDQIENDEITYTSKHLLESINLISSIQF